MFLETDYKTFETSHSFQGYKGKEGWKLKRGFCEGDFWCLESHILRREKRDQAVLSPSCLRRERRAQSVGFRLLPEKSSEQETMEKVKKWLCWD